MLQETNSLLYIDKYDSDLKIVIHVDNNMLVFEPKDLLYKHNFYLSFTPEEYEKIGEFFKSELAKK